MTKFLIGRDNHLFLANDSNGVQMQTMGELTMEEHQLHAIFEAHRSCFERMTNRGSAYIHVIAPNKETSYREFLPDGYVYERFGPTPLRQYAAFVPEYSKITFMDAEALLPHGRFVAYYKGESHWTPQAAVHYMSAALGHFKRQEDRDRLNRLSINMVEKDLQGDLAIHADMPSERVVHAELANAQHSVSYWGDIVNEGYVRRCSSPTGKGRALILHDSFVHALFPFLSEIYSETLFIHCPEFLLDIERAFNPDIIIRIQAERFFPHAPKTLDNHVTWIKEIEVRKGTAGRTTQYLSDIVANPV